MNLETVAKSKLCCSQLQHNISQICMFLQLFKQNNSGVLCYTKQYLSCEQKIQNYLSVVTKESKRFVFDGFGNVWWAHRNYMYCSL